MSCLHLYTGEGISFDPFDTIVWITLPCDLRTELNKKYRTAAIIYSASHVPDPLPSPSLDVLRCLYCGNEKYYWNEKVYRGVPND